MKFHWLAMLGACIACTAAHAGVTRIVIDHVDAPTFDAREFGTVGRYEKLSGKAFGEIDPADPLNAGFLLAEDAQRLVRDAGELYLGFLFSAWPAARSCRAFEN